MRTCPHCGKQFPDNLIFCPDDQHPLRDDKVHWDDSGAEKIFESSTGRFIKIGAASAAFVPMIVLILTTWLDRAGILSSSVARPVLTVCVIFNYPVFSMLAFIKTFTISEPVYIASALVLMLMWSSLLAWFFWKVAAMFLGEDEPSAMHGKYDWVAFQMRFVIGFIVGFLLGWRFVRYTTSMKTMFAACFISGIVGGFLYGVSRPPDFWSRG